MALRRGFSRTGPQRSKRLTEWGLGPGGTGVTNLVGTGSAILGSGVAFTAKTTVIRIRGLFSITLQIATSLGDGFFGAVGIAMVQTPAFTAGIASLPTPVTEANSDAWLWHSYFDVRRAIDPGSNGSGFQRIVVDSKAMRKAEGFENTIYAAVELTEVGAADVDIFFDSRLLGKLS